MFINFFKNALSVLGLYSNRPSHDSDSKNCLSIGDFTVARISTSTVACNFYYSALDEFENKKYRKAIALLHNALEIDRENISILSLLGRSYSFLHKFDHAILFFDQAAEIARSANGYFNLATAHFRKGNLECAKRYYRKALEFSPENREFSRRLTIVERLLYGREHRHLVIK